MSEGSYTIGGTIAVENPLYISRRADAELLELCRQHEYAYVLTARQLGKSSLMVRTSARLRSEEIQTAIVDLQRIGKQGITAAQWYSGLFREILKRLQLDVQLVTWWQQHEHLGMAQRLVLFFEELVLVRIKAPLVIFVDEIDTTIGLDFADDFFVAIRSLYEARAQNPELRRLSFVLIGTASPSDLIGDPNRTPFNIGRRVDLSDFTAAEAFPLTEGFGLPQRKARRVLRLVLDWTGGHPYLTQRLCRTIAEQESRRWNRASVRRVVTSTFFEEQSRQDPNLEFVRTMLLKAPNPPGLVNVLLAYQAIHSSRRPVSDEEQSLVKTHLKLTGVVRREATALRVRNPIYRNVFNAQWIKEHLPTTWPQRLRRARRIAFAIIVPLLVLAIGLAVYAWNRAADAQAQFERAEVARADAISQRATAEARRQEAEAARAESEAHLREAQTANALVSAAQQTDQSRRNQAEIHALDIAVQTAPDPELGLEIAVEGAQRALDNPAAVPAVTQILRQAIQDSHLRSVLRGTQEIKSAVFSPDGRYIATAGQDTTAQLWTWDAMSSSSVLTLTGHTKGVNTAAFSPDGRLLVTAGQDTTTRIWDIGQGSEATSQDPLRANTEPIYSAAFSPDGRLVVTASRGSVARVWDWQNRAILAELRGHRDLINTAAFSPDGRFIVTASGDRTARVWPWGAATGTITESVALSGHTANVLSAAFSPDGQLVVTASSDGTARVWSRGGGDALATLQEDAASAQLYSAAFSPDGELVVIARGDGTAQIWRWRTQEKVSDLIGHTARVWSAEFSADGKYVVTASSDGTVRVWEVSPAAEGADLPGALDGLLTLARTRVVHELTPEDRQKYFSLGETPTPAPQAGTPTPVP